jgi:Zn-dependent peptidase ImmA (M78 family)
MSRTTGLPIRAPLKKQILSRAEIRKYLESSLQEEYTPQEIHVQESALKAFGLVSREFDLAKFLLAFYTEQAAGAYDPRRQTMFIADWPTEEMQKMVLAHELTHALQDQNFDLEKFLHAARERRRHQRTAGRGGGLRHGCHDAAPSRAR